MNENTLYYFSFPYHKLHHLSIIIKFQILNHKSYSFKIHYNKKPNWKIIIWDNMRNKYEIN
jgi:hypothetical protein